MVKDVIIRHVQETVVPAMWDAEFLYLLRWATSKQICISSEPFLFIYSNSWLYNILPFDNSKARESFSYISLKVSGVSTTFALHISIFGKQILVDSKDASLSTKSFW